MAMTRKQFITGSTIATGAALLPTLTNAADIDAKAHTREHWFGFSLNTSTIRGQKLGLVAEIDVAIKAGYDGIEPWISTIKDYQDSGGSLADIRKRCADEGLNVCSAIGFAQWIVDDEQQRAAGIEQMKHDMALLAQIGGTHIAAPPVGANSKGPKLDLDIVAERYLAILKLGRETGVTPQIETWGPSTNLSHVAEATYVAAKSGHPDACILADAYHMYKGNVAAAAMKIPGRAAIHCFHMNDYPADPPRASIKDSDRVWPGDGIAPLNEILSYLAENHCRAFLSLELFNQEYWKMEPLAAAQTGIAKMKAVVRAAGLG